MWNLKISGQNVEIICIPLSSVVSRRNNKTMVLRENWRIELYESWCSVLASFLIPPQQKWGAASLLPSRETSPGSPLNVCWHPGVGEDATWTQGRGERDQAPTGLLLAPSVSSGAKVPCSSSLFFPSFRIFPYILGGYKSNCKNCNYFCNNVIYTHKHV